MIYMTDKWDLSSAKAAAIVNSFWGVTDMLQIVMKFFLHAFVGNFRMALFFGSAYSIVSPLFQLAYCFRFVENI